MKKPDKYYLTDNPKEAKVTLCMRLSDSADLPPEILAYGKCFDCGEDIVYSKLNKKVEDMAKICNECFQRHSGLTVSDLINASPKVAARALAQTLKDIINSKELHAAV